MSDRLYKYEDNTALRFEEKPMRNNAASEKAGHPVFDTALMVQVIVPGATESMPEYIVERVPHDGGEARRTSHYNRFKEQIEAYKSQEGGALLGGTPLAQWPQANTGLVHTLKACGVYTVEQLSEVTDGNLNKLGMGAFKLREQAQEWLKAREFGVPTGQIVAEAQKLRERNEYLEREVQELRARLAASVTEDTPRVQVEGGPTVEETSDPFAGLVPEPAPQVI